MNSSVVVNFLAPTEPNWVRIPPSAEKRVRGAQARFAGAVCGSKARSTGAACGLRALGSYAARPMHA